MIAAADARTVADWILEVFGYVFKNEKLCFAALTHRSAGPDHNERLEFLGDSVLNCAVAQLIYQAHPEADEGALSRLRASLVREETLAHIANEHGLGEFLRLGSGELKSGGFRRASILADTLEALLGAIMVDSGFDATAAVVRRLVQPRLAQLPAAEALKDAKTRLQEALQAKGIAVPAYTLSAVRGEPHALTFAVACEVTALGLSTTGEGASRRRAEQFAADRMLALIPAAMRSSK